MIWESLSAVKDAKHEYEMVYVFGNEDISKIGVSSHPHMRRRHLSGQAGRQLSSCYVIPGHYAAYKLEKFLHNQFVDDRGVGEWFACSPDTIVDRANVSLDQFPLRSVEAAERDLIGFMKELWLRNRAIPTDSNIQKIWLACYILRSIEQYQASAFDEFWDITNLDFLGDPDRLNVFTNAWDFISEYSSRLARHQNSIEGVDREVGPAAEGHIGVTMFTSEQEERIREIIREEMRVGDSLVPIAEAIASARAAIEQQTKGQASVTQVGRGRD